MDYVFANFFAAFAALVFSIFTSFIATRSGRPIYRKIMWGYVAMLMIAAIVISVTQISAAVLAFVSIFSCIGGVVIEAAIAVKLGHLHMADAPPTERWRKTNANGSSIDAIRNSAGPLYNGVYDPLRRW
ncbi:hypothetical protein [Burkholderia gladioli]|uniref:hypothetical protein n=1 Tax=Burkholderia gladioli TaxID=28095 RepID=UPI001C5D341F|nr:hypothetical protein [Burkholderia gladioli]MBW5287320.1 hypothetical protein [Burkholderia gladioli]